MCIATRHLSRKLGSEKWQNQKKRKKKRRLVKGGVADQGAGGWWGRNLINVPE